MSQPTVTFIIATHNRREVVLDTLAQIDNCGLPADAFEVIVVDNASSDDTPQAVKERFGHVHVIARSDNRGSCAKAFALDQAQGTYIVFLDDDSWPHPGCVARMIQHFERDERLGAAGYLVHLLDGRMECSALPNVFIGCGVGFRASALRAVGGLDTSLFMQAEEYDLSFRLIGNGWRVQTFADLHVTHHKTPQARLSSRTTYYDTRNNLLLIERYLPPPYREIYRRDWIQRYRWLAARNGHRTAYLRAVIAGTLRGPIERHRYAHRRLTPDSVETLFRLDDIRSRMADLCSKGIRRVVFADLGKNIHAFVRAAAQSDISALAIADDAFASVTRRYQRVPVIRTADIPSFDPAAIVVSNTSFAHATATRDRLMECSYAPVHCWFDTESVTAAGCSVSVAKTDTSKPMKWNSDVRAESPRVEAV